MEKPTPKAINRRSAIRGLGLGLAASPALGSIISSRALAQSTRPGNSPIGALKWALGGTAVISKNYPDPFLNQGLDMCALPLTCSAMLGPCYDKTYLRKDISEGQAGIPMRMAFRVLNEDCKPVSGASVDVWHTSETGLYSGEQAAAMCTLENEAAVKAHFFRGVQYTNAQGRCDFDSCFPGWYPGRTTHIHFTIRVGNRSYLTSQLYFPDSVSDDINKNYVGYKERGPRDTTNLNDGLIPLSDLPNYQFTISRLPDGVMLATKTLILRNSLAKPLCET